MAAAPILVYIDEDTKKEAAELFSRLGLDLSSAVNLFLHPCILRNGLPFPVEMPQYSRQTLDAMAEARRISRNRNIKGYTKLADLKAPLESDL